MKSNDILKDYPFSLEMHAHTSPVSPCAAASPEEMIMAYAKIHADVVVVTNHFYSRNTVGGTTEKIIERYINDFDAAYEAGRKSGIRVILGAEMRFADSDNDYLVYGVERDFLLEALEFLDGDFEWFSKKFRSPDRLILQAHPKRAGMTEVSPSLIDGVETFNFSRSHDSHVYDAVALASKNPRWVNICGSDFHYMGGEGTILLRTKRMPEDSFDLVKLLRSGEYIFALGGSAVILP